MLILADVVTCSVDVCDRTDIFARGMCCKHYKRWWKTGDPLEAKFTREVHGLRNIPEYEVWNTMKQRCSNKHTKAYKDYGGRGITVCIAWRESFLTFYQDMGKRPTTSHTLERVENDEGYNPDNVIWAIRSVNRQNQHNLKLNPEKVRYIRRQYFEKVLTIRELALELSVSYSTIYNVVMSVSWGNIA